MRIAVGLTLWLLASVPLGAAVSVVRPEGVPPLEFAAREAEQALKGAGETAAVTSIAPLKGPAVVLRVAAGNPESFTIHVNGERVEVIGGDVRGAMYGGLDVAEQIHLGGRRSAVKPKSAKPFLPVRAYKFNLPLPGVGYAGAESLKYNQWFYDLDYWTKFIEMMARSRYNALSFWSAHPYDRLLRLSKYPEATDLSTEELRRNQEFFHRLFTLARDHGLDTYIVTWNIHVSAAFAKAHGIPASGFDSEVVRDYQKECIRELLTQYPELTGVGTCPGEAMGSLNVVDRENWIRETYLRGITESGRTVPFILRYWGGEPKATADMLSAANYPGPVYLDIKFNGEHVYSSPRPHLQNQLWLTQEPKHYKVLWHLRNDDLFTLRWGDPEFVRETVRNCGGGDSAGFVMGSEIEIPGTDRIHTEATAAHKTWDYEFEKQWLRFMLWGRLGYSPTEPESLWAAHYSSRFGPKAGPDICQAVKLASKILPTVTAFHWNYMNGDWYPEGCVGSWNTSAEMPRRNYRDKEMFHSVVEFLFNNTIDDSLEDVPSYVLRTLRRLPHAGRTPPEAARQIGDWARAVWRKLPTCAASVSRDRGEWECTRRDLAALSALGQYYEQKILGSVALGKLLMSGDESARAESLADLTKAARWWRELAEVGDGHYREHEVWLFGQFSWGKHQSAVERDLDLVREAVPLPRTIRTWETRCVPGSIGEALAQSKAPGAWHTVQTLHFDEQSRPEWRDWLDYLNQSPAATDLAVPVGSGSSVFLARTTRLSSLPAEWEFHVGVVPSVSDRPGSAVGGRPATAGSNSPTLWLNGRRVPPVAPSSVSPLWQGGAGGLTFEAPLIAGSNQLLIAVPMSRSARVLRVVAEPLPWRKAVVRLAASDAQGIDTPMQTEPDAACRSGKALFVPKGVGRGFDLKTLVPIDRGRAEFPVTVADGGTYVVIARCYWPDGAANSFYVSFDDGPPQTLGNEDVFDTWHWVTSPPFPLTAGPHRLVVRNREDGARMDQLVIAEKETTAMTPTISAAEPAADVLTATERERFFHQYFARMTEPKPLTRFKTKEDWLAYRTQLREKILRSLGLWPLPERLSLDPHVTGRIDHDDYSVERVFYQVLPKVYASGYLYVPKKGQGSIRYPAVLNPHGHWPQGAVDPVVQTRCIGLVKKGFVAFCPDSTHVADFPMGLCPIGQMTWNNIRALDYLQSLAFVDPGRIGCTGASGGGQQTMYLAALEERVKVVVPVVMVSYLRRILFPTEEAHCSCNHAPGIAGVTDETEMAAMFAPRPTRFVCATGDWTKEFPREEFPEIRHIFSLVGGDVDCVQFDKPHNYDQDSREQMYAWMNRYLKGESEPNAAKEPPIKPEAPDTLKALSRPVPDASGLEGAAAFYRKAYMFHAPSPRTKAEWRTYQEELRSHLRDLLGEHVPEAPLNPQSRGEVEVQGLRAERLLLNTEPAVAIPAWLFLPGGRAARGPAVVIAHPAGKQALLQERVGLVQALLQRRSVVLAVDTRMRGELKRNWQWNEMIWGRPEDGMAAHDLIVGANYLRTRSGVDPKRVFAFGIGEAGLFTLYAAALDTALAGAALDSVGPSYAEGRSTNVVPNVLRYGDLPQFAALVAPRPLWLNGASDSFTFAATAYRASGGSAALHCLNMPQEEFAQAFVQWIGSR